MSNRAITWAYGRHSIKAGPKFVLVTLADMADQEHSCYPGIDMLATLTGFGTTAIRTHLDFLINSGLITEERRHKRNGARTSNRYYLQIDVAPKSAGTPGDVATDSDDVATESGRRSDGIRGAYKDEPSVNPKGEPSDGGQTLVLIDAPAVEANIDADFEEFWTVWPRKVARKPAADVYRRLRKSVPAEVILAGARRYAAETVGRDAEHIAHAKSWLNAERWTDEAARPATPQAPARRITAAEQALAELGIPTTRTLEGASLGELR